MNTLASGVELRQHEFSFRLVRRYATNFKNQVEEFTGLSRYTIYRFMGEGTFPKQIKLGKRAVGWLVDDVNNWLASRAKAA